MSSKTLKYFVGGIPSDVKQRDLYDYFRQYGAVKRVTVFNSNKTKKLFGFCFVKFKSVYGEDLSTRAQEFVFQGRKLEVDPICRRSLLKQSVEEKHSKRVFLQNVPRHVNKADLLALFSQFGPIHNCFVVDREATPYSDADPLTTKAGSPLSDYGYIIFENKADAEECVRRKYLTLPDKTRIHVKKYCSRINRPTDELEKLDSPKSGSHSTSADDSGDGFDSCHWLKPTCKAFFSQHQENLRHDPVNLRFRVACLPNMGPCPRPAINNLM